ncbi:hypothetical protein CcaCcLH18_13363 [Colletotrichum camelliae]|nr:hypothetical protein CcaCcLH18_13363 [Colletotrichum camelliae]
MAILQLFDLVITGYVDDVTILLASSSYELNCEALAQVYRRLTRFTSLHGTEFSADKTHVIHLCQSRKAPVYRPLPSVRPIFAYACALWYVVRKTKGTRCKWSLCHPLINKLETEQTLCLKQSFGAYQRLSGDILCKEFFVEKLAVFLAGYAMKHRATNLDTPEGQERLRTWLLVANGRGLTAEVMEVHPLNVAYREAKPLVCMVADDELQLRIRADPKLANNPVRLAPSHLCSCVEGAHNAKHLFLSCKLLENARKHLLKALPELTFENLVTRRPRVAADFAIRYFDIPQFRWTAKHMPNPAFGNLGEEEQDGESSSPPWRTKEIFRRHSGLDHLWFVSSRSVSHAGEAVGLAGNEAIVNEADSHNGMYV